MKPGEGRGGGVNERGIVELEDKNMKRDKERRSEWERKRKGMRVRERERDRARKIKGNIERKKEGV